MREPVTAPQSRSRGLARPFVAAGLALLIALTASPVSARPIGTAADRAGADLTEDGGKGADEQARANEQASANESAAASENAGASGVTQDLPSVHWLHAQAHAADVVAFEPGARVTVPFKPRADDRWEVDGEAPRALPPGHATGREMHDAPEGSIWAAGAPGRSGDAPGHAKDATTGTGLDETVDLPIVPLGGLATTTSATGSPSGNGDAPGTGGSGSITAAPIGPSGLRREVFGFLPYWELTDKSTTLDWRTLSTVAYFSVGCTSTGSLDKRTSSGAATTGWAGWTSSKMTSVINAAHEHRTRVVLTVSCFAWSASGASIQASLLGSATRRATLAKQIAAAVRDRGADGANLDFEPIVPGYADEFTALVRKVRSELNNVAPGYQLTFDTMGSIGNQPIAAATAPGGADAVFVMGYDYRTAGSSSAGSIAPLTGPLYDLTDTVKAYTAKISPSKVILGVPYYGRAWSTVSDGLHAKTLSPSKYGASAEPFYAEAIGIANANGRRWDSVEQSAWTAYRKQTCTAAYGCVTSWRQLYYDDAASLKRKYDLVNREHLRGVGIWALGYDDGRTELRAALADKFLADRTAPVVGIATLGATQRDEGFRVSWKAWDDSPIKGYDVDVAVEGGAWKRWLTNTRSTSAIFAGRDGTSYAFRARATDVHDNVAAWKVTSSAGLGIPSAIRAGGFATVLVDGLRMRTSPSTGAPVMATLDKGAALQVIAGPTSGGGYTWFQVAGPIKQWAPVDRPQVGGWIAAFGNGVRNAGPRRPVYATRVDAGITGLKLNGGGPRVLTPNGDGDHDRLRLTWTNHVDFDRLALRVFRLDGTAVGSVGLGGTDAGGRISDWNGRVGGKLLPPGAYILGLQGTKGAATYHAPSASPVSSPIATFGFVLGPRTPTSVVSFRSSPTSPTTSGTISYVLTFGGSVRGLAAADMSRSGTATGCKIGAPTGSGATWTIKLTGCSAGTVKLTLKAGAVSDAVSNSGPRAAVGGPTVVIDRSRPTTSKPKVSFRTGAALASTSASGGIPVAVTWSARDTGGAGLRDHDVRRSVDGGPWADVAVDSLDTTIWQSLSPGHVYRYEVRARDRAGNVGPWVVGPAIPVVLRQDDSSAITWRGTWQAGASTGYSRGTVRFSTAVGAAATYSFTGRAVAFVTTKRPDGGKVKVYIDGTYVKTIDLAAGSTGFRQIAYSRAWSTTGTHRLRLVVVGGAAGQARVDVDALAVLR